MPLLLGSRAGFARGSLTSVRREVENNPFVVPGIMGGSFFWWVLAYFFCYTRCVLGKARWLFVFLILAGLVAAVYLSGAISQEAALSITSDPDSQTVYIDEQEVGTTPYFSDQLSAGDPVVRFGDFNQKVRLTSGALTVVDWVLGPSEPFSAGHVVWFSESSTGTELLVISNPAADVFLNEELLGESPLSKPVDVGEYDLEIKKDGYFSRKLKISIKEGFRLNVSANLSLNPFLETAEELSSPSNNLTVLDLSSEQPLLSADPISWVRGAVFWSGRDEDETEYGFFLTSEGKLYDSSGSEVSLDSLSKTSEKYTLGYLGINGSLTSSASKTLNSMSSKLYPPSPKVQILETGLGFLRVRSGPGVSYDEIGKATPGDKYTYLGKSGEWFKINFNGQDGWVYSDYAKKL